MRRINNNTLREISNLTTPVLKLAKYLQESKSPFYINHLNNIESSSMVNEYILAFDKDLNETVNLIHDLQVVWKTADRDGIAHELNTEEKDLTKLFNINNSYLEIFDCIIMINTEKDDLKRMLLDQLLPISEDEYKVLLKKARTNSTEESLLPDDANEDEKFLFLIRKATEDNAKLLAQHISKLVGKYIEFRNDLTIDEKKMIDEKITQSRTMVDGVLDTSTYITEKGIEIKDNGDEHISRKHNKLPDFRKKLEKIETLVKESGIFYGTEIDQDTSLDKIINVLEQCKNLKLNTNQKFILKARKLGNYNANGIYFDGFKIVSVDVNSPSALIHELTHAVDFNNDHVSDDTRIGFINLMRERLKEQYFMGINEKTKQPMYMFPKNYSYLSSSVEIIARAGELGYLLQKHNYQGHQDSHELMEFFKKVNKEQKEQFFNNEEEKNILICKPINTYISRSEYFGFNQEISKDYLLMIKDFYKGYYNSKENVFKPLPFERIKEIQERIHKVRERSRVEKSSFTKENNPICFLNLNNFVDVVNYNNEEEIFSNKELVSYIFKNFSNFSRTRKVEDNEALFQKAKDFMWVSDLQDKLPAKFNQYLKDLYYYTSFPRENVKTSIDIAKPVLTKLELKEDFEFIESASKTLRAVGSTNTKSIKRALISFAAGSAYSHMINPDKEKLTSNTLGFFYKQEKEGKQMIEELSLPIISVDSLAKKDEIYDSYFNKLNSILNDMKHDELHKTIFLYGQILDSLKLYTDTFKADFIVNDLGELKSKKEITYEPKSEHFFQEIETTLKCLAMDCYPRKLYENENNKATITDEHRSHNSDLFGEGYTMVYFRNNQISSIESHIRYRRRLSLDIESTDFKEEGKIEIFDRIIKEIKNNPDNVFKNKKQDNYGALFPAKLMKKVVADECTIEDKVNFIDKLKLTILNVDLLKDVINKFVNVKHLDQEKAITIFRADRYESYRTKMDDKLKHKLPLLILRKNQKEFFEGTYVYNEQEVKEQINKAILELNLDNNSNANNKVKESISEEIIQKFNLASNVVFNEILNPANILLANKGLGISTFNTIIEWANNVSMDTLSLARTQEYSEKFLYPILLSAKGAGQDLDISQLTINDNNFMKKLGFVDDSENKKELKLKNKGIQIK